MMEDSSVQVANLRPSSKLQFSYLLENLDRVEDILADTDLVRLERDILVQIGRLGAFKLFHACLIRTLAASSPVDPNILLSENFRGYLTYFPLGKQDVTTIVRSGKAEERKLRRTKAFSSRSEKVQDSKVSCFTRSAWPKSFPKSRSRSLIARNESEMSKGVKVSFTSC